MKTIYLEVTLKLMLASGAIQQSIVQNLLNTGSIKETKTGVKYLLITE